MAGPRRRTSCERLLVRVLPRQLLQLSGRRPHARGAGRTEAHLLLLPESTLRLRGSLGVPMKVRKDQEVEYDIDAKIEEAAHDLAVDRGLTSEDLYRLRALASNPFAVRVFTQALKIRAATTEELCRSTTLKST